MSHKDVNPSAQVVTLLDKQLSRKESHLKASIQALLEGLRQHPPKKTQGLGFVLTERRRHTHLQLVPPS